VALPGNPSFLNSAKKPIVTVASSESKRRIFGGAGKVFDENKIPRATAAPAMASIPESLAHGR